MAWILAFSSFCLGAALGFWAEVTEVSAAFLLAIIFSVLGVGGYIVCAYIWLSRKLWPGRTQWVASFRHGSSWVTSEALQKTLAIDYRLGWTSTEPQAKGDAYKLDLGKDRVIDGVEFYYLHGWGDYPAKWHLLLLNKWGALAERPIEGGEAEPVVKGFPPRLVRAIELRIIRPRVRSDGSIPRWRIEDVRLREVRLWRRWWRREI